MPGARGRAPGGGEPFTHLDLDPMRSSLPPLLIALSSVPAVAQSGASGSEQHVAPARELLGGSGASQSETYRAETAVASTSGGVESTSSNFRFRGSTAWVESSFAPAGATVFGVVGGGGTKDGGEIETVFGAGFQSGAPPTVTVGGLAATGVSVLSDTELTLVTPGGIDALGNPLGAVDVTVDDGSGPSTAAGAYRFEPAIEVPSPLKLGQPYKLAFHGTPGSLIGLYNGAPLPGFALPVNGIDGAFDLVAVFFSPVPTTVLGAGPQVWTFPLPNDPILAGKAFQWQGFEIDSFVPLGGSFTNRLTTPISN